MMYSLSKKILCFVKIRYVQLLISFLQVGGRDEFIKRLLKKNVQKLIYIKKLLYNFKIYKRKMKNYINH